MAMAENSSSSQDDDFQASSHAGQLFIFNKLTVSYPSKRRKKDGLSIKKAPSQKPEHVSKAGKENQNPNRRRDGSKGCSSNPETSHARRPLEARTQNVRNAVSFGFATKKQCRTQVNDETLADSLTTPADKKQKLTGRFSKDSPEKPTVDDECKSLSRRLAHEYCSKQENEIITGSHSLASRDDACVSPLRPSSHEHHLTRADSPGFAVEDACIISSKPLLHEQPLKEACATLKNSLSLAEDEAHISLSMFSSCDHLLEHARGTSTDAHYLTLHDAHISDSRHLSNRHHYQQANLILTGSHPACKDSLMPSLHEHYKQADEALVADEGTFEMLGKTQKFSEDDAVHQSPESHDCQQEELAKTNRPSPVLSQISVLKQ